MSTSSEKLRLPVTLTTLAMVNAALLLVVPGHADESRQDLCPDQPFPRHLPRLFEHRQPTEFKSHRHLHNGYSRQFPSEYRTLNGDGNNRTNPAWGAAEIPFLRSLSAAYEDGYSAPNVCSRPSARLLSENMCAQDGSIANRMGASDFVWQWGQFLDHDIDETPSASPSESLPIAVPLGDPWFDPAGTGTQTIEMTRSAFVDDADGVRHQVNAITAFIDGSNVYGSDAARVDALRMADGSGKMKTTASKHGPLLPYNVDGFPNAGGTSAQMFFAGDVRANEQVGLTAMHTLFVREHNHWAEVFRRMDSRLSGDELYHMARIMVVAEMQAITYREFLPVVIGDRALPSYRGYRSDINPGISNLFAASAYRFGHSMLSENLQRYDANGKPSAIGPLPLAEAFFNPGLIASGGIDTVLRGLASQAAQRVDLRIVDSVRNFLFGPPGAGGFDLAALNIQRGRDHGLPDYRSVRIAFGLSAFDQFADFNAIEPELTTKLEDLYGTPDKIDAWIGMLAERHVNGAMVGETVRAVLADQFTRLRDGDRFWYQNYLHPNLQRYVERQTLAVVIRRNSGIGRELRDNVFRMPQPRRDYRRKTKHSREFTSSHHQQTSNGHSGASSFARSSVSSRRKNSR